MKAAALIGVVVISAAAALWRPADESRDAAVARIVADVESRGIPINVAYGEESNTLMVEIGKAFDREPPEWQAGVLDGLQQLYGANHLWVTDCVALTPPQIR